MGKFLAFLLLILITIPVALLRGVVLSDLWEWFVTPLGVPGIGVIHAIGISFVIGLFFTGLAREKHSEDATTNTVSNIVTSVLTALVFWGFGWLWHLFL